MIEDIGLRESVLEELEWDPKFDATHVTITAEDGAVALGGHVDSYAALFAVRKAVRRVSGIRAIADNIAVELPSNVLRGDDDIATSIAHVLDSNIALPGSNLRAEVRAGVVTIHGIVDWQAQRQHIEEQIVHVSGVRDIFNEIVLRPNQRADDVKLEIEKALARNAEFEADHVNVRVDGEKVFLTGTVKAYYERGLIEMAAWSAPGVREVVDDIRIA